MNDTSTKDKDQLDQEFKEKLFDDLNQALTKDLFSPIKQIYVEWSYLQDVYLGAIISQCKSQSEYNYILSQLDKYNDRLIRNHSSYFPELHYTDKDLETYMNIDNNNLLVLGTSPMTNIFRNLKELLDRIDLRNSKLGHKEPLRLIINLYPLILTQEVKGLLSYMLNQVFVGVEPIYISSPINKLPASKLIECDILLIDRMDLFFCDAESSTFKYFFSEPISKFVNCAIITPKVIDNSDIQKVLHEKSEEDIEEIFKTTSAICGLMTDLIYINPIVYADKPVE